MYRSTLMFCCALVLGTAQADMYRWVDKQGNVHYSDQVPPEDAKESSTIRKHREAPVAATAAALPAKQKTYSEMEADFKKRRVEKEEAEAKQKKELAEAAEKKKNCERARNHAKSLQRGGRFTRTGPDGEQIFLDEKEIENAKEEAGKQVEDWCKS